MDRENILRRRIRLLTWFFIVGLVVSGATAIPLEWELNLITHMLGLADGSATQPTSGFTIWILKVRDALHATNAAYPFMAYGTDWLAFGHFMIAVAFLGALRDPVRNVWLFTFGMIACALIVPYAFLFGGLRGIPVYWRLIDCSFGVFGILPVWYCWRSVREIEALQKNIPAALSQSRPQPESVK
ncbi:MAG: hypothetical protein JWR19_2800 [Pedosphaera sp.]|nr:hypothetical protein [Pedosphaera sp.]